MNQPADKVIVNFRVTTEQAHRIAQEWEKIAWRQASAILGDIRYKGDFYYLVLNNVTVERQFYGALTVDPMQIESVELGPLLHSVAGLSIVQKLDVFRNYLEMACRQAG